MELKDILKFVSIMLIIIVLFLPDYGNTWKWVLFIGIFVLVLWTISEDKFALALQFGGLIVVGVILFGSKNLAWDWLLVFSLSFGIILLIRKFLGDVFRVW